MKDKPQGPFGSPELELTRDDGSLLRMKNCVVESWSAGDDGSENYNFMQPYTLRFCCHGSDLELIRPRWRQRLGAWLRRLADRVEGRVMR